MLTKTQKENLKKVLMGVASDEEKRDLILTETIIDTNNLEGRLGGLEENLGKILTNTNDKTTIRALEETYKLVEKTKKA